MKISTHLFIVGFGAGLCCLSLAGHMARAEMPTAVEPDYAEAVLAYNAKDFQKALQVLDAIQKKHPDIPEALELKALVLKMTHDHKEADVTYQRLIEVKTKEGRPEKEVAAYHFELALLRHREKKFEEAQKHFHSALKNDFNEGVCHLYLGMYAFQSGAWAGSEEHFKGVISSGADDLKPAAYFYLGQAYGKTEYPSGATESFISARNAAKAVLDDADSNEEAKKIAKQIYEATEKSLAPFDRGQFFGNAGFIAGYDTNVLALPPSVSQDQTSGKSSMTTMMMVGVGYATSPLRWIQAVPSYRGFFGLNLNRDSSAAEFPTHLLSVYLTGSPLSRFSYGLRLEGNLTFQNTASSSTGRFTYSLFSKSFTLGPYIKYEIIPKLVAGLEVANQARNFSNDGTDSARRSGNVDYFKLYLKYDKGNPYFNPHIALKHDGDKAAGSEYKYDNGGIEIGDAIHWSDSTELAVVANLTTASYNERSGGPREDSFSSFELSGTHKLNKRWTILASSQVIRNKSSVNETYSYNRFTVTAGASYAF